MDYQNIWVISAKEMQRQNFISFENFYSNSEWNVQCLQFITFQVVGTAIKRRRQNKF